MSSTTSHATTAPPLLSVAEYQEARSRLFPSAGSLAWYIRVHKAELVQRGAMLMHRGIWHIDGECFDVAVRDIARAASKLAAAA